MYRFYVCILKRKLLHNYKKTARVSFGTVPGIKILDQQKSNLIGWFWLLALYLYTQIFLALGIIHCFILLAKTF